MDKLYQQLPDALLPWYESNKRDLPWRTDSQPYHVWLSEIMLQQTRVEAVRGYYSRFLKELPTISALSAAEEDTLHKLWEGLGYYSRVRNLKKAAQTIMNEHGGEFPHDYAAVRALSGIGDYTAGAICSICFEQPTPAVDGNVLRVISRVTESFAPITELKVRREIAVQLARVYPAGRCGAFTQSLMELGATVCVPNGAPHCECCPLAGFCLAYAHKTYDKIPVKPKKTARRIEEKTVFILQCGARYAVLKRPSRGLLAGLWSFPNVEGRLDAQAALDAASAWDVHPADIEKLVEKSHIFTHIEWKMHGVYLRCRTENAAFTWVTREELETEIALPTAFRQFWE